jgi:predicted nucleic acid-binding protein
MPKSHKVFLDSSALVKYYVHESGSEDVAELLNSVEVVTSSLCLIEILSAFNRLRRNRKILPGQYKSLKASLLNDLRTFEIISINELVLSKTVRVIERASVKSLDAIQIASALASSVELFVTSDHKQSEAAQINGLTTKIV